MEEKEQPTHYMVTADQMQFLIQWIESVPIPRASTNEVVVTLQKITNQPATAPKLEVVPSGTEG